MKCHPISLGLHLNWSRTGSSLQALASEMPPKGKKAASPKKGKLLQTQLSFEMLKKAPKEPSRRSLSPKRATSPKPHSPKKAVPKASNKKEQPKDDSDSLDVSISASPLPSPKPAKAPPKPKPKKAKDHEDKDLTEEDAEPDLERRLVAPKEYFEFLFGFKEKPSQVADFLHCEEDQVASFDFRMATSY